MLRDEIVPYTGKDGLVWSSLSGPGGNGVLYTAEYYTLLNRLNQLRLSDTADWIKKMVPCEVQPGLIQRVATDQEQEGPDDYVGYLTAACILDPYSAFQVYNYGKSHWGCFNNVNPGKFNLNAFLWRQPQLIAHAIYGMKKTPNFILRIIWIITILIAGYNTNKSDTDTSTLSWLLIQSWRENGAHGIFSNLAVKYWRYRLLKVFGPTGMQAVYTIYFGASHPLVKYMVVS